MTSHKTTFDTAAYGGEGWSPRETRHEREIGTVWASCGQNSEWAPLKAVLLHRPDSELAASAENPNAVQMLAPLDIAKAGEQHDGIAEAYAAAGVEVRYVEPREPVRPNQMFCADLMFATPAGVILARPASTVRAGEERQVARRLADIGVPILRTLTGQGTFEGADAMFLDPQTVLIGRGLRTNVEGARLVAATLAEVGIETIVADMPFGSMHLMGMLRVADKDLAIAWARRTPHAAVAALRDRGFQVAFVPPIDELENNGALNFVTLGPRKILMAAGNPATRAFYESLGIDCRCVAVGELAKAAGAVGCLTGVLRRELI